MITLNGRFCNNDTFTVISSTGKSVLDYALGQVEQFQKLVKFEVKTVLGRVGEFLDFNAVALPSIIQSTQTDSCCPKSTISHEKIALKLTA